MARNATDEHGLAPTDTDTAQVLTRTVMCVSVGVSPCSSVLFLVTSRNHLNQDSSIA